MGKLTYVLRNDRTGARAHVLVDGTDVHSSHPRGELRLVSFRTGSDKEALAKFQEVIKTHFHPRDGWTLDEKRPGKADYPELPKAPSAEELAFAAATQRERQLGYAFDGNVMVLNLARQRTAGDLGIALERADKITTLFVITSPDDEDGVGVRELCKRLETSAPHLRALSIDCPWEPQGRAAQLSLAGVGALLDKRSRFTQLSLTGALTLAKNLDQPALESISLCGDPLAGATLGRLAQLRAPPLTALHLCLSVEGSADPAALDVLPTVPPAALEVLTVEGAPDLCALIERLLARKALPARVQLDGGCADGDALFAALKDWKKRAKDSALALGDEVRGLLDEEALARVTKAVGDAYASPFLPTAHDPRVQALWKRLA